MKNLIKTEFDLLLEELNEAADKTTASFDNRLFKSIINTVNGCLSKYAFNKTSLTYADGEVKTYNGISNWRATITTKDASLDLFAIKREIDASLVTYKNIVVTSVDTNARSLTIRIVVSELTQSEDEILETLTALDSVISTEVKFDDLKRVFDFWNTYRAEDLNEDCLALYNSIDTKLKAIIDSKPKALIDAIIEEQKADKDLAWIICLQYFYNAYIGENAAKDLFDLNFITNEHDILYSGGAIDTSDFTGAFLNKNAKIEFKCYGSMASAQDWMNKEGADRSSYHDAQFILMYIIGTNKWYIAQNKSKLANEYWIYLGQYFVPGLYKLQPNSKNRTSTNFVSYIKNK